MVIIDIELSEEKYGGIALANSMSDLNFPIIYLTGQENEETHAHAYSVGNYLPLGFMYKADFFRNPTRAVRNLERLLMAQDPTFIVEEETAVSDCVIERFSNVLWIYGEGKQGEIQCRDGSSHQYKGQKVRFLEQQSEFPIPYLFQASRNYIINIHQISAFQEEGKCYLIFFDKAKTLPSGGVKLSVRQSQVFRKALAVLNGKEWQTEAIAKELKRLGK